MIDKNKETIREFEINNKKIAFAGKLSQVLIGFNAIMNQNVEDLVGIISNVQVSKEKMLTNWMTNNLYAMLAKEMTMTTLILKALVKTLRRSNVDFLIRVFPFNLDLILT